MVCHSAADSIVPGDTNGTSDIFVRRFYWRPLFRHRPPGPPRSNGSGRREARGTVVAARASRVLRPCATTRCGAP
ncbi:hypothetical protein DD630_33045 [Streptomyces sp. BSE7F]|nr:hypothetical protein DD630_33045 [Streptomyces sp. BSE7F]